MCIKSKKNTPHLQNKSDTCKNRNKVDIPNIYEILNIPSRSFSCTRFLKVRIIRTLCALLFLALMFISVLFSCVDRSFIFRFPNTHGYSLQYSSFNEHSSHNMHNFFFILRHLLCQNTGSTICILVVIIHYI